MFGSFSCSFWWPSNGWGWVLFFCEGRLERIRNQCSLMQPKGEERNSRVGKIFVGNNGTETRGCAAARAAREGSSPTVVSTDAWERCHHPGETGTHLCHCHPPHVTLEPISSDGHRLQQSHLGKLRQGICQNASPGLLQIPITTSSSLPCPKPCSPRACQEAPPAPEPSLIPEIPHGSSIASFASSCPVCPVEVHPCVLLITFLTKPGFPAGICPFQTLSAPSSPPHTSHTVGRRSTGHDGDTGPPDRCPVCLPGKQHPLPGRNCACVSLSDLC